MRNNHINTAIKALKKQREKYAAERDKAAQYEEQAKNNKAFFEYEIQKLDQQIELIQGVPIESIERYES